MKNIYKILIGVLTTCLLLVALDWAVGTWSEKMYYKSKYSIFHKQLYCLNESKDDILVMGSSRAAHHYVPQILEDSLHITCYNAGSDGECIYYHYCLLASMIERGFVPKVVIYEVMNLDAEKSKVSTFTLDAALDRLAPHFGEYKAIDELFALNEWTERLKLYSKTYRYNSKLVQTLKCNYLPEPEDQGYEALLGKMDSIVLVKEKYAKFSDNYIEPELDDGKIEYVKKFINICKKHNIKLIFCYSPYYKQTSLSKGVRLIKTLAFRNNVPFYIFIDDKEFKNASLFSDKMHLNDTGAKLYTLKLIESLKINEENHCTFDK